MRILLVEDDGCDSILIERWLRPHHVVTASCAADAQAIIHEGWDLILCDMGLPDSINMTAATTTVTEILSASNIPLIRISGHPRDGVVDKTAEAILEAIAVLGY